LVSFPLLQYLLHSFIELSPSSLFTSFSQAEQERIEAERIAAEKAEEERKVREEAERIEAEKQAELERIERERQEAFIYGTKRLSPEKQQQFVRSSSGGKCQGLKIELTKSKVT
jgi:hypothetical protein